MEIIKTKQITQKQFQQIDQLWNEEYPVKLKDRFSLLLEGVDNFNHYFIEENNQILAWAVTFEKENETRFSIIVGQKNQGKGFGSMLINHLKRDLGEFYGWVIDHGSDLKENGAFYQSPLAFYRNKGFEVLTEERIDNEMINAVKIKNKVSVFVETQRFILREILPGDVDGMFALDSDPEVHKYLGNKPVSNKDQSIQIIDFIRQQYISNGIGRWAIVDKETNEFIGWAGLKFVTEAINNHRNFYDLGYRLVRKYWGQGIGTEVAFASLNYAFQNLNLDKLYASASCENEGSNKILKKLGFNWKETYYYDDEQCNWYTIERSEYERYRTE